VAFTDNSTSTATGAVSGTQHQVRAAHPGPAVGQRPDLGAGDRPARLELGRAQPRLAPHLIAVAALEDHGEPRT
jgi:hypothetical protein